MFSDFVGWKGFVAVVVSWGYVDWGYVYWGCGDWGCGDWGYVDWNFVGQNFVVVGVAEVVGGNVVEFVVVVVVVKVAVVVAAVGTTIGGGGESRWCWERRNGEGKGDHEQGNEIWGCTEEEFDEEEINGWDLWEKYYYYHYLYWMESIHLSPPGSYC